MSVFESRFHFETSMVSNQNQKGFIFLYKKNQKSFFFWFLQIKKALQCGKAFKNILYKKVRSSTKILVKRHTALHHHIIDVVYLH